MVQVQFRIFWDGTGIKIISETMRGGEFSEEELKFASAINILQLQAIKAIGKDPGMKVRTRKHKPAASPSAEQENNR
jgi:hypothetical protein